MYNILQKYHNNHNNDIYRKINIYFKICASCYNIKNIGIKLKICKEKQKDDKYVKKNVYYTTMYGNV